MALASVSKSQNELYGTPGQSVIDRAIASFNTSYGIQSEAMHEIHKLEGN